MKLLCDGVRLWPRVDGVSRSFSAGDARQDPERHQGLDAAFQLEKRFPPSSPVSVTAVILASRRGSRLSLEGR